MSNSPGDDDRDDLEGLARAVRAKTHLEAATVRALVTGLARLGRAYARADPVSRDSYELATTPDVLAVAALVAEAGEDWAAYTGRDWHQVGVLIGMAASAWLRVAEHGDRPAPSRPRLPKKFGRRPPTAVDLRRRLGLKNSRVLLRNLEANNPWLARLGRLYLLGINVR